MSAFAKSVERQYKAGRITKETVISLYNKGKLTEAEMKTILGE